MGAENRTSKTNEGDPTMHLCYGIGNMSLQLVQ